MLKKFKEKYRIDCEIEPTKAPIAIDRRLRTIHDFNSKLKIPSFEEMLKEL